MGFLRPAEESTNRSLFRVAHAWGGRCLALLSITTVFIGISAFHLTSNADPSTWIGSVLLLLFLQLCTGLFFELGPRRTAQRRGIVSEVNMVQIPYARPGEQDSDEHYTTD